MAALAEIVQRLQPDLQKEIESHGIVKEIPRTRRSGA
jgi:hypothetical protein